jgi:hypothetical protein
LNNGKDGGRIDELIQAMELEPLAMDAFFHKEGQVLVKDVVRHNRGFSIGITGGQSTSKKLSDVAKPSVMRGTQRYGYLFMLLSQVREYMADQAGVDSFYQDNDTILQEHMASWTRTCSTDPDNKLQHISIILYLGELSFVKGSDSYLHPHCDDENCPIPSFDWLASVWKRIYFPHIGRFCDVVITGAQRKSTSDLLNRQCVIGEAATDLNRLYGLQPESPRDITIDSLCPSNARFGVHIIPIHCETTLNFSSPLHHIDCLRSFYATKKMLMSGYLANEMLLGFFVTNNPFRYNEFAKRFVQSVIDNSGELPLGVGETFLGKCQEFITGEFGGFNGSEDTNKLIRGAPRWQSTNNHPKFEHTNFDSLRFFEDDTKRHSKIRLPGLKDHKSLMISIMSSVSGVGKLLSQKLMFADAMMGLHLGSNWLLHCLPGSATLFGRLKKNTVFKMQHKSVS